MTSPKRSGRPRMAALLASAALLGGGSALGACQGSATPPVYTPFTGITVPASEILRGHRCGDGSGDVYKYTVVVWYGSGDGGPLPGKAPLYSGVWDCFADAVFENLPSSASSFFFQVFAFTASGFPAALACPGGVLPDQTACVASDAGAVVEIGQSGAQWETTCSATQVQGTPVNAVCAPLAPSAGGAGADAGPDQAALEAEAAAEASAEAAVDAPVD